MTVLCWQTMANRASGSEGWCWLCVIACSNLVGSSSRMRSQCRMCLALALPELFQLVLMGKQCKSVPGGWVGCWTVQNLLPLESEVSLYPLCSLKWEALSLLAVVMMRAALFAGAVPHWFWWCFVIGCCGAWSCGLASASCFGAVHTVLGWVPRWVSGWFERY